MESPDFSHNEMLPLHVEIAVTQSNELDSLYGIIQSHKEGDCDEFHRKLKDSKKELVLSVFCASEESTEYNYSTIIKLQGLGFTLDSIFLWKNKILSREAESIF